MSRIDKLLQKIGIEKACDILERSLPNTKNDILTIVSNRGTHFIPDESKRGEIFYASEGNLDFSSIEIVKEQYEVILSNLAEKLKSSKWKKVYIIPFGHSTLSMQIKLIVYRITRIETIDLFYDGQGNYYDLSISQRSIIVNAAETKF